MAVLMVLVVLMLMVVRVWGILFAHSEQSKTTGDHRSTRTGRHPRSARPPEQPAPGTMIPDLCDGTGLKWATASMLPSAAGNIRQNMENMIRN